MKTQEDRLSATTKTLLQQLVQTASLPMERAMSLPPALYYSPEVYDLELERIFRREWMCVARVDEIKEPGDYLAVDLAGEPLVLTRDEGGGLHALSRVCRHRAADLMTGVEARGGNLSRLVCPYHLWTYKLDGRLAGAPEMQGHTGFDRSACALPEFRLEVWRGFVFVNLDPSAAPLAPRMAELEAILEGYGIDDWRIAGTLAWGDVDVNWKVAMENACECYHHMGTHRHTLESMWPARTVPMNLTSGRSWLYGPLRVSPAMSIGEDSGFPIQPTIFPPAEGLTPKQRSETLIVGVFPMFFFALGPDALTWFRWFPTGPTSHRLDISLVVPPRTLDTPDLEEKVEQMLDAIRQIQVEDAVSNAGVQRGLMTASARPGPLSSLEQPLWQFQRYLAHRLAGAEV